MVKGGISGCNDPGKSGERSLLFYVGFPLKYLAKMSILWFLDRRVSVFSPLRRIYVQFGPKAQFHEGIQVTCL